MTDPKVIFEDKYIFVLDKPAGWVVTNSETVSGPTIQNWLSKNYQFPISNFPNLRNGIVHRLDKDTSGILLVAKDQITFENLQKQFKERKVQKKYQALVHGVVKPEKGFIKASISRSPFNRKKFGVFLGGKEAVTEYKTISNFQFPISKQNYTMVELRPKTGRTHQIRVHLKYLGYPVVADEFYTGGKTYRADKKWCPRQFLHAASLSFCHPSTGKRITFASLLSADLKMALEKLAKNE